MGGDWFNILYILIDDVIQVSRLPFREKTHRELADMFAQPDSQITHDAKSCLIIDNRRPVKEYPLQDKASSHSNSHKNDLLGINGCGEELI
ncbi:MAG: hypothetical protein MASP_01724 [Candidatus Methanolliviera sp. GoM_asphalt]|nr:MAG: hypothetical protein MASP_01724 [Candidatus Methanolliviera sp. GoM_asphalt]